MVFTLCLKLSLIKTEFCVETPVGIRKWYFSGRKLAFLLVKSVLTRLQTCAIYYIWNHYIGILVVN